MRTLSERARAALVWSGLIFGVLVLANAFNDRDTVNISYARFVQDLDRDRALLKAAADMKITPHQSHVDISYEIDGKLYSVLGPAVDSLYDKLAEREIDYRIEPEEDGALLQFVLMWLPMTIMIVLLAMVLRLLRRGYPLRERDLTQTLRDKSVSW